MTNIKVSLPERGQPIDVAYINQIVTALNALSDSNAATYNYTTVDVPGGAKQNIKTSEARIIGGYVSIVNNATINASNTKSFTYTFPNDLKYTPIVTATPVNYGKTAAGENVSVILTDITRSSVSGIVKFGTTGVVSVAVNLIILGVPN